ncbi:MAG: hypothetical protein H0U85_07925 [Gemmatimonadales bacterium]|nr:hypothetical protein [Gemmatimonadales bacterium]
MNRPPAARWWRRLFGVWIIGSTALLLLPLGSPAAIRRQTPTTGADLMTVTAGAQYGGGAVDRFLLGGRYRRLWTVPVTVPVLHLARYDGGLRPTGAGGGMQTHTLHLASRAGRSFDFRSVDKVLTPVLPRFLERSAVGSIVQSQVAAGHPAAVLMAVPLQAAAGLAHAQPTLVVLPDDTLLGPFRAGYAGVVGVLQEVPSGVLGTAEMLARLDGSRTHRADAHAFLTARLLDLFLNDWDRHEGQWRWAAQNEGADTVWRPIPVDRDQAFSSYEGLLTSIVRVAVPKLPRFDRDPDVPSLTINSARLDRRLLGKLSRGDWDSTAAWLVLRLDDSTIDSAVRRMPLEWWRLSGPALAATLRQRRNHLPEAAERFRSAILAARAPP